MARQVEARKNNQEIVRGDTKSTLHSTTSIDSVTRKHQPRHKKAHRRNHLLKPLLLQLNTQINVSGVDMNSTSEEFVLHLKLFVVKAKQLDTSKLCARQRLYRKF